MGVFETKPCQATWRVAAKRIAALVPKQYQYFVLEPGSRFAESCQGDFGQTGTGIQGTARFL
jgi:hypothetical protein